MTRIASPVLATSFALAMVALGSATAGQERPTQAELTVAPIAIVAESNIRGVPVDALPRDGQCRIWYDGLAAEKQPADMECQHANWVAQRWGGRVIQTTGADSIELASYDGKNDFTGVPTEALPRRGYCRAWVDGVEADQQSEQTDCRTARQIAEREHGHVLFMPL